MLIYASGSWFTLEGPLAVRHWLPKHAVQGMRPNPLNTVLVCCLSAGHGQAHDTGYTCDTVTSITQPVTADCTLGIGNDLAMT